MTGEAPPGTSTFASTTLDRLPFGSWTAVVTVNSPGSKSGVRKKISVPALATNQNSGMMIGFSTGIKKRLASRNEITPASGKVQRSHLRAGCVA